jgi:hypothetical protein
MRRPELDPWLGDFSVCFGAGSACRDIPLGGFGRVDESFCGGIGLTCYRGNVGGRREGLLSETVVGSKPNPRTGEPRWPR